MKITSLLALSVLLSIGVYVVAADKDEHEHEHKAPAIKEAVCTLLPTKGNKVMGTVVLKQIDAETVELTGKITGLTPGMHGFHIHEAGDLRSDDGESAGGHYNPDGHPHGGPDSDHRHAGDLGNVEADDAGVASFKIKTEVNLHFVLGRSLVVHANPDDLKSQPAGNAGPRVAVGVIGIANVKKPAAVKTEAKTTAKTEAK